MKCASLIILCLTFHTFAALFMKGPVVELSDSDFEEKIATYGKAVVLFYVSEVFEELLPAFDKASYYCDKKSQEVTFVKVSCSTTGINICDAYSVENSVVKLFRNGRFEEDYDGVFSAAGIVDFIEQKFADTVKVLQDEIQLKKFLQEFDGAVVGFFWDDSELKSVFMEVAGQMKKMLPFGIMMLNEPLPLTHLLEAVVVYRPVHLKNAFEKTNATYDGVASAENLTAFIKNEYYGLVGHRTVKNVEHFNTPLVIAYFDIDYVKNPKYTNYWRNRILMVAKTYADKIRFAISSSSEFVNELRQVNAGPELLANRSIIVVAKNSKDEKFIMDQPFSVENFKIFVESFLEGKITPYMKSEELPEDNSGFVKIVVGKNFAELVTENNKDTFIEFYAPWCGHCKQLAPVFEELGEKLQDEDVLIAKLDATANDVPKLFEVEGYPTLYLVAKDQNDAPKKYEGKRDLNNMLAFIASEATDELKGYDRSGKPKHIKTEL